MKFVTQQNLFAVRSQSLLSFTPGFCRFAQVCDIGPRDFFRFWYVVSTTQGDLGHVVRSSVGCLGSEIFWIMCSNYAGNANTQHSPWHAMLSRVMCHLHPLQCLHGSTFDSNYGAGRAPPSHTPPPGSIYISIASTLAPESQIVMFDVFQQNPIVVTAELDTPIDPSAMNPQA